MMRKISIISLLCIALILIGYMLLTLSHTIYADGTYAGIGTGDGVDGSNDAINFSQGRVWTIDQYGKYIWLTQARGPTNHWAWSNDNGATWSQSAEGYTFLTRGSVAYDSINDVLHVIWAATDTNDGIIYRRYGITRDGSNNITAIARINTGVNVQLDTSASRSLDQPVVVWLNDGSADGILLAFWSKYGASLNEIRGSMRRLSMTDADGVAGNWLALDGTGDTFSTDPPAVAADKIYNDTSGQSAAGVKIRGGSGSHKDDLYVFVAEEDDNSGDQVLVYRGTWSSGSLNWSGGWTSLGAVGAMNTSSGYSLKYQLITKPVIDTTNDRLYIGWSRWKDGTNGDTVSIAYLNSTDTASSTVDIYSALGTHSYAPTLDIAYDQTLGQIYTAYILSTTNGDNGSIQYKTYDGSTLSSATTFYTSPGGTAGANGSADIPILYENRSNNRLLFAFRVNGALPPTAVNPHVINWGYITLANPTSTPTPTSTSSQSSGGSGSTSSNTLSSKTCTDLAPISSPNLYQIDVSDTQAVLQFVPVGGAISNYTVSYGYSAGDERFNAEIAKGSGHGALSYTINNLAPQSVYFLKIRANNNCQPGGWGNEMKITTAKKGTTRGISYFKNFPSRILSIFPKSITHVGSTSSASNKPVNSCEYVVQPGDSLWKIALDKLGNGRKYTEIIAKNKSAYPGMERMIHSGWKFKIGC